MSFCVSSVWTSVPWTSTVCTSASNAGLWCRFRRAVAAGSLFVLTVFTQELLEVVDICPSCWHPEFDQWWRWNWINLRCSHGVGDHCSFFWNKQKVLLVMWYAFIYISAQEIYMVSALLTTFELTWFVFHKAGSQRLPRSDSATHKDANNKQNFNIFCRNF